MSSQKEPSNFSWVIPDTLAAHGLPESPDAMQYLWDAGIRSLVSLTPDSRPPIQAVPKMIWTRIGVDEGEAPTMPQVEAFVAAVEESSSKKEALSVHCRRGGGRTGTMLACYLVKSKNINDKEAIDEIRKQRPGSVENAKQEAIVKEYYEKVKKT